MKLTGIIFSDIYDTRLGQLTKERTAASVPFGGRYRFVDFALSNMVNSGVSSIGVITKHNYESLMEHLGGGSEWDLNRKNAGLYILPPFATGLTNIYRGTLEALFNALPFIENENPDFVILCDTTVICNIDFNKVLLSHIDSGADVTVVCTKSIREYEKDSEDLVICERNGVVADMAIGYMLCSESLVGAGMYIIETKKLIDTVKSYVARGRYCFERDFLLSEFIEGRVKINTYVFEGALLRCHNVVAYFKSNFLLMEKEINSDIFKRHSLIRTKVRDEAPSYYHDGCIVQNCLVADGCKIEGQVIGSVLFRGVVIEKGATVQNSIVMQGTKIGKNARVSYAITDKGAMISPSVTLSGAPISPAVINKEERI